jgi:hypothetical protein
MPSPSQLSVQSGQSLWSIAKTFAKEANPAANDADIKKLANAIAAANGLSSEAQLKTGQTLTLPDVALRGVSADALQRLSTRPSAQVGALHTRLGATAKPLIDFKAVFVDNPQKPKGEVKLPDVAAVPLKGEAREIQSMKTFVGEAALLTTHASFGKLTQSQFDAVHKELGGKSSVKFDANRNYSVVDFLPPALQALANKDLEVPDLLTLKGTKKIASEEHYFPRDNDHQVGLTMNCHATAYEGMRAYQGANANQVAVFYGEMITMDGIVQDAAKFQTTHVLAKGDAAKIKELDLKPGDLVQFYREAEMASASTDLMHSAIYVGGGLFFEKPNTEGPEKEDRANYVSQEETPFRIATAEHMLKPVHDSCDGLFRIEVRRPTAPLDDPHTAFGSSYQKDFEKNAEKKGRTLGAELVTEFEQGMGGNIRGEGVSALVRVKLTTGDDGVAKLA